MPNPGKHTMPCGEKLLAAIRTATLGLMLAGSCPGSGGWDEALTAERNGDYARAFIEYRQLAEGGDIQALHNLGVMYYNAYGVYRDYGKAMQCFLAAAEHGIAGAQNNVGFLYAQGHGVQQDFVRAHMWFAIAAAYGEQTAIENRAIVAARMNPSEIAEAGKLAQEWLEKHPPKDRPVIPPSRNQGPAPAASPPGKGLSLSAHSPLRMLGPLTLSNL
jgi:TPR repeat protein